MAVLKLAGTGVASSMAARKDDVALPFHADSTL